MRSVARRFRVALSTVQLWFHRARGRRLDRVSWKDRAPGCPRAVNRTLPKIEDRVLELRRYLRDESPLGEFGAAAIHREMIRESLHPVPTVRTIDRILERRGALDGRRRIRHPPPPRGWYLPEVASAQAELDSFDVVEGLVIQGHGEIEVLNAISLHGGLPGSWPQPQVTAKSAVEGLLAHWQEVGLPGYAQFDNDTRFQGPHQHPDSYGRVIRLCLGLGVIPVFAPPRESGFQAAIENYNGRWQSKVWQRFHHSSLPALQKRSDLFVAAARQRAAARSESAPARREFPHPCRIGWQQPLSGKVIFLRRTNDRGQASLFQRSFLVDRHWVHRLVRAEIDFDAQHIDFFTLRRRDPHSQSLIQTVAYVPPKRYFRE